MTSVAVLVIEVGGLVAGATAPWRVGVGGRLAAVRVPRGDGWSSRRDRASPRGASVDPRGRRTSSRDVVLLLDLLDMAVSAGAGLPRALEAVGEAVGGADGDQLARVSVELLLGAPWSAAWAGTPDELTPIAECLEAAWVQGANSGVEMEVWTTEPGLQLYIGQYVAPTSPGLEGRRYKAFSGLCLEAQTWPDAPNRPYFPQATLWPGQIYHQVTEYRFRLP